MLLFTFLFPPISVHSAVVTFALIVKSRAFYCPYWSSHHITKVHANEAHTSHPAVGKEALIVLKEELSTEYQLYNYIRSICLNFVILLKNKNDYCSLKIHQYSIILKNDHLSHVEDSSFRFAGKGWRGST